MGRISVKTTDDYIASQQAVARRALRRVRAAIHKAAPGAEEVISYGMPALKWHKRILVYFAAWKEHCSIYPATGRLPEELRAALAPYLAGKGTLRFPLDRPAPVGVIGRFVKFRRRTIDERMKTKAGASKKRGGSKTA